MFLFVNHEFLDCYVIKSSILTRFFEMLRKITLVVFFFQAEDGIRDATVTGVQTCALPISTAIPAKEFHFDPLYGHDQSNPHDVGVVLLPAKRTRGITPLQLPPAGYLDQLAEKNRLKDQKFLNVGYGGDVPTTGQPIVTYDGVRKVSTSTYMALEANWLWLSMNAATGNGGDCYGDSGGPKLLASNPKMVLALAVTADAVCRATTKDYRVDSPSARAFLGAYVALS